jgi:hypothetical protein
MPVRQEWWTKLSWTNRIHVEDAAAALLHLAGLERPGDLYCVTGL